MGRNEGKSSNKKYLKKTHSTLNKHNVLTIQKTFCPLPN